MHWCSVSSTCAFVIEAYFASAADNSMCLLWLVQVSGQAAMHIVLSVWVMAACNNSCDAERLSVTLHD